MLTSKKNIFYRFLIPVFLVLFNTILSAQDPCDFQTDVGEDINVDLGDSVQLQLLVSVPLSNIESVLWTPSNTLSCSDCYEPIATPTENICYIVMVTDTSNCTLSDTICLFVQPTATHDLDRSETIDLFPNPTSDILTINSDEHVLSEIKIFDALGQQVQIIAKPDKHQQIIYVSELEKGIYYLEAKFGRYFARREIVKL